jgi:hypothetical protein
MDSRRQNQFKMNWPRMGENGADHGATAFWRNLLRANN